MLQILLADLSATNRFGLALAQLVSERAIITLQGSLGAGKTTLVKAVGKGLGVVEVITSPTFTMLNEYHSGRLSLFHLDLYRAGETGEIMDLSLLAMELDEVLDDAALLMIEWPQYFIVEGQSYFDGLDHLEITLDLVKVEGLLSAIKDPTVEQEGKVLRETYERLNLIKEGNEEARIANLVGNGPNSTALIGQLRSALTDMVIYL